MSLMILISGITGAHDVCTLLYASHAECVPYKSSQSGTNPVSVDCTLGRWSVCRWNSLIHCSWLDTLPMLQRVPMWAYKKWTTPARADLRQLTELTVEKFKEIEIGMEQLKVRQNLMFVAMSVCFILMFSFYWALLDATATTNGSPYLWWPPFVGHFLHMLFFCSHSFTVQKK